MTSDLCESCKADSRIDKERFCKKCKAAVLAELRDSPAYLPVPPNRHSNRGGGRYGCSPEMWDAAVAAIENDGDCEGMGNQYDEGSVNG